MTRDYFAENPLTMVYNELWNQLEARTEFDELIKEGNRIKFNYSDPAKVVKTNISEYDVPEILASVESVTGNLRSSSNSTSIIVTYGLYTATADYRYNDYLAQVQWTLLCTLVDWHSVVGQLKWNGRPFIKQVSLIEDTIGAADINPLTQTVRKSGWTSFLTFSVRMDFKTNEDFVSLDNTVTPIS